MTDTEQDKFKRVVEVAARAMKAINVLTLQAVDTAIDEFDQAVRDFEDFVDDNDKAAEEAAKKGAEKTSGTAGKAAGEGVAAGMRLQSAIYATGSLALTSWLDDPKWNHGAFAKAMPPALIGCTPAMVSQIVIDALSKNFEIREKME